MNRIWPIPLVVAAVLTLTGCGDGNTAASSDAASEPTPTVTATATSTASSEAMSVATPEPGKCDEVKFEATETSGTSHPGSNFFAPDAKNVPSEGDLGHLLLQDNAVVVLYAASTPKRTRDRLESWWYEDVDKRTPIVVPD